MMAVGHITGIEGGFAVYGGRLARSHPILRLPRRFGHLASPLGSDYGRGAGTFAVTCACTMGTRFDAH